MAAADTEPPSKQTFHFINDPAEAINEASYGLTHLHPTYLSYLPTHKILYRSDLASFRASHVTVIAFSGGGHEPMFSGFVGPSFLSASVSGAVFASPTAAQILRAIELCQPDTQAESKGTLVVCGNYTGDILNAGLAVTRATAAGKRVVFVPVGDDVAVGRAKGGKVGRRGLSGHLVGLKAACALAEEGEGLERVAEVMGYVADNVGTVGVAFDRVALPNATLTPLHTLPIDTIELGMGAHGEPGLRRISPVPELDDLTGQMLDLLLDTTDKDRSFIPFSRSHWPAVNAQRVWELDVEQQEKDRGKDNHVVLLLNSLGSTSDAFLGRVAELAVEQLAGRGFVVRRLILGPLVTSLKMSGFGITLWRLPPDGAKEALWRDEALKLWDRPVTCEAWRQ
ncbi:Dak kinase [Myriangium duriaei CBS 260.36]|uniref:Dak kinase n=1 Tax=Myriangium duriaei CBS 260.36 TaxID=1168546 RepID=A0A9P4J7V1_9PEZI|nr:Dak kinase [Myriangium duriaei CBS 260.36]